MESDIRCSTFVFENEDHTMGNALRYVLVKDPTVEFAGYTVPHPAETKMNVRVQTSEGLAVDALKRAADDLREIFSHMKSTFVAAIEQSNE